MNQVECNSNGNQMNRNNCLSLENIISNKKYIINDSNIIKNN
jgi:hypothetical protein